MSTPSMAAPTYVVREEDFLPVSSFRRALAGFSLSGMIFAFLGLVLPIWGYHLKDDPLSVGYYFLALNAGVFVAYYPGLKLLLDRRTADVLAGSCTLVALAWVLLAFLPPPAPDWSRFVPLFLLGLGGAAANAALMRATTHLYEHNPSGTTNLAGICFNLGGFGAAILAGAVFYEAPPLTIFLLFALAPLALAIIYRRTRFPRTPTIPQQSLREAIRDFRSPTYLLLALVVFFQFGNEYAIAGWLNLYLIQRLGISPKSAIQLTALYWLVLPVGRVLAQSALLRFRHMRVLLTATISAMLGCLILMTTNNTFGATTGIIFAGLGFGVVLPLVFDKASGQIRRFHPGFFNGIFSLALTGGLLAPFSLGVYVHWFGARVIMALPLVGTALVFVLLIALWIESLLAGPPRPTST